MARILISTPMYSPFVCAETDLALRQMDYGSHEVIPHHVRGFDVARARNMMAQAALDEGCGYILMVDSDIVPPVYAFTRLMSHGKDMVLGWYPRGTNSEKTNMVRFNAIDQTEERCYPVKELESLSELVKLRGGGLGFALISTEVFRLFQRPWFEFRDFASGAGMGEDYVFCDRVRLLGVDVLVDPLVRCGHVKETVL